MNELAIGRDDLATAAIRRRDGATRERVYYKETLSESATVR